MDKIYRYFFLFFLFLSSHLNAQVGIDFIEKISTYKDSVKYKFLAIEGKRKAVLDSSTFDADTYRKFFDKLYLPKGKKLQCYYEYRQTSSHPHLFVTSDTLDIRKYLHFLFEKDSDKSYARQYHIEFDSVGVLVRNSDNFLENNFIPEDSKEGYLQYLYLINKGEYFAYLWHDAYAENEVLISNKRLDNFLKMYNKEDFIYDINKFKQLYNIDKTPKVYWGSEYYLITWYELWTHRGVFKCTYKIDKKAPHEIEEIAWENILPIDINFIY